MVWAPTTLEYIERLRRRIHVHSVLYYHLNAAYISDTVFDQWSNELVEQNKLHPELIKQGDRWELFVDWTGETGMHLPADERVISLAHHLLRYRERHNLIGKIHGY